MVIEYCDQCGYKLSEDDFHDGKGYRVDGKILCHKCTPAAAKISRNRVIPVQASAKGSGRIPGVNPGTTAIKRASRTSGRQPSAESNSTAAVILSVIALALIGLGFYLYSASNTPTPRPAPIRERAADADPPPQKRPSKNTQPERATAPMSMLLQAPSQDEARAQQEFDAIEKIADVAQRIDSMKKFVATTPPDFLVTSRARVALKNLEANAPAVPVKDAPAELVGWWRLDDGKGTAALDSAGKSNGVLMNGPEWVKIDGKSALHFKDDAHYVELPNSAALDTLQDGDYSVAAWFRPDSNPVSEDDRNHCGYSIIAKAGNHAGLHYYHDGYLTMDHWLRDNKRAMAVARGTFPPQRFYHVAGVLSVTRGETLIYVDGKLLGRGVWPAGTPTRPYGNTTWKIGIAAPGAAEWSWPAKGAIRDVRLYKGLLTEKEIEALAAPEAAK
ncbi:MAG TPA: LamG domain-containing protein [Planctomycetota bacterium]|nr:LamG domain-containing protein [Planctomycetota bacterium]